DDRPLGRDLDHREYHAEHGGIDGVVAGGLHVPYQFGELASQIVDAQRGQIVGLRGNQHVLAGDDRDAGDHIEVGCAVNHDHVVVGELDQRVRQQPVHPQEARAGDLELRAAHVGREVEVDVDQAQVRRDEVEL